MADALKQLAADVLISVLSEYQDPEHWVYEITDEGIKIRASQNNWACDRVIPFGEFQFRRDRPELVIRQYCNLIRKTLRAGAIKND
jgi:hypothetical protein